METATMSRDKLQEVLTLEQELFLQWKEHPTTQALLKYLKSERDRMKEMWAGGAFAAPSIEEMAIRNAAAQGYCSALDDVLTIDEMTFRGEE